MSPGNKPATTVTDEETIVRTSRIANTAVDPPAVDEELSTRSAPLDYRHCEAVSSRGGPASWH